MAPERKKKIATRSTNQRVESGLSAVELHLLVAESNVSAQLPFFSRRTTKANETALRGSGGAAAAARVLVRLLLRAHEGNPA